MTMSEDEYKKWEEETLSYMPDFIDEDEDDHMFYQSSEVI